MARKQVRLDPARIEAEAKAAALAPEREHRMRY